MNPFAIVGHRCPRPGVRPRIWTGAAEPGATSEINGGGLVTHAPNHPELVVGLPDTRPRVIGPGPLLTTGLPPERRRPAGTDVLTHAMEAHMSTKSSPCTDAQALQAARMTARWLPAVTAPAIASSGR
jgi:alcohol dehydrogenase class IV